MEQRFARWVLHPKDCPADPAGVMGHGHFHESNTCAEVDGQLAWALVINRAGLNADMLTDTAHTDTEFVWTFDTEGAV